MSSKIYPDSAFISAVTMVVNKMDEERRHRKFLEENTRKVLIEKAPKPKPDNDDNDDLDLLSSYLTMQSSDFALGFKTYKFEI